MNKKKKWISTCLLKNGLLWNIFEVVTCMVMCKKELFPVMMLKVFFNILISYFTITYFSIPAVVFWEMQTLVAIYRKYLWFLIIKISIKSLPERSPVNKCRVWQWKIEFHPQFTHIESARTKVEVRNISEIIHTAN